MTTPKTRQRAFWMMSAAPLLLLFAASSARAEEAAPASATNSGGKTVEVLTVTANKREESLQQVAASISAVSGATIAQQRLQTVNDLQNAVAGLVSIPSQGDAAFINMRGTFTHISDSAGSEQGSSVYIDDVATLGPRDLSPKLFDIDRVEVLRGPQGTAFGKNTVGGVVSIHTKAPSFTPDVQLSATGGNYSLAEFTGLVTGPISDRVAVKLSAYDHYLGGTVNDPTLGRKIGAQRQYGVGGQVLANLTDKFKVLAGAAYAEDDSDNPPGTFMGDGTFALPAASPVRNFFTFAPFAASNAPDRSLDPINPKTPRRTINGFVRADWDLDFATLTSITGYRHNTSIADVSVLGDPVPFLDVQFTDKSSEVTQELRLVSPADGKFTWLAGVYVSAPRDERRFDALPTPGRPLVGGQQVSDMSVKTTSQSVFGEIGYKFTDQLKLVLGGRYTDDRKTGNVELIGATQGGIGPQGGLPVTMSAPLSESSNAFTPKATLEFTPTSHTLFYATYSKGYIGGGFEKSNGGVQPSATVTLAQAIAANIAKAQEGYRPEYATNYEVGAKTSWFDGRLVANMDIYRENFRDLQVVVVNPLSITTGTPPQTVVVAALGAANAGRTRSQGFDLELHAAPAPWLRLGVTYSYSDDTFLTQLVTTPASPGPPPKPAVAYAAGNHLPFTPTNALNFSAAGEWVFDWGTISAGGDVTYRSKVWSTGYGLDATSSGNGDGAPVHDKTAVNGLVNGSIDYKIPSGRWDVRLWVRNLTDTRYEVPIANDITTSRALGYNGSYYSSVNWNQPRMFGITASYHMR
jgi:iron complex outermembrane receptor protein